MRLVKTKIFNFLLVFLFLICFNNYSWSQSEPPQIEAVGDSFFCPTTEQPIVTSFSIANPNNIEIVTIFIQISEGYDSSQDRLKLSGANTTVTSFYSISEGKLTLTSSKTGSEALNDLIEAAKDVVFYSSINVSGVKKFSFTINEKNYLPSTGHFYEYIPQSGITWEKAKSDAEDLEYYGLKGYLATITSKEESQLAGEQATGQGWIGGSDAQEEGVWRWVTGPETGKSFWIGGINGTTIGTDINPPFSDWSSNEPNDWPNSGIPGEENYAHVYDNGKWNDYPNSNSAISGYIVEYGGMPGDPEVDFGNNETTLTIAEISEFIGDERCGSGEVTISANSSSGFVVWYDVESGGTPIGTGSTLKKSITETTTFYALASVNGCVNGERTPVKATVNPLPIIQANINFKNCDEDGNANGYTSFNLKEANEIITKETTDLNISYHYSLVDAEAGNNTINTESFNNEDAINNTVYARVENIFGCFLVSTVTLEVSTTSLPLGFMEELTECDDDGNIDGIHSFDLTKATTKILEKLPTQPLSVHYFRNREDALLEKDEILPQESYLNQIAHSEKLYVRVETTNNGNCYGIGEYLTLIVNPIPEFDINPKEILCLNSFLPITLEPYNVNGDYSFIWTNENNQIISTEISAEISSGGEYTVIATNNLNCESFPRTILVEESIVATISLDDLTIIDDSRNNSITINDANNNLGDDDYEYALNNEFGPFKEEPFFNNVPAGIHTLYVRDTDNCGTAALEVSIIGFPKFFTPNNDGYNDTWNILGINNSFYPTSSLNIFDRYGKLLAQINPNIKGWNGLYNGKELPSSDYWFTVQLKDKTGKIRNKQGHFSLVRR